MKFEAKMTREFAGRVRTARVWSKAGAFQVLCEASGKNYEERAAATLEEALTAARTWVDGS